MLRGGSMEGGDTYAERRGYPYFLLWLLALRRRDKNCSHSFRKSGAGIGAGSGVKKGKKRRYKKHKQGVG